MSKNKKIIITVVVILVLGIIVAFLFKCYINKKQEEEHQQLMQETVQGVEKIHNNSYLFGYEIFDLPPADFKRPYGNDIFIGEKEVGYYNCWEFGDGTYITTILLRSEEGNLFSMKVGDTYEQFSKVMEEEGYVLVEVGERSSSNGTRYLFKKAYIAIGADVLPNNEIECIWVSIDDPTIPWKVVD